MSDPTQGEFLFVDGWRPPVGEAAEAPTLDAEIAAVWRVPIGAWIGVVFRGHDLPGATGRLEIAAAPDLPFDARRPLQLRIGEVRFTDRQIASWVLL